MTSQAADHRRATAERNVAAILDATAALLSQQGTASIAAVAAQAGVSRVTVYAHFPERGQADGSFRADVPAGWLVTSFFALIHACAGDVHAGWLDAGDAQRVLTLTVTDLFAGGRR
jgi:AcrR family transcriptional regulator